ncbi:MAG: AraC family transcriptional regulator ligand-binding domain-containing protein [Bacteroidota bacterium]
MAKGYTLTSNWRVVLRDLGLHPGNVLRRAGLPADLFARTSASVSAAEYFRLWDALEHEMGDRLLALEAGQGIPVEAFDPPIFAALCSPDLNAAAERLSMFKRLIGPFTLDVTVGPEQTVLTYGSAAFGPLPFSAGMTELVFLVHFARRATRTPLHPVQVMAPTPPKPAAPYEDFFGVRIRPGSGYTVAFSAHDAQRPFLTANAGMWAFFEPVLTRRLAEIKHEASIAERVYAALFELLPSGQSSVQTVSATLGLSVRSLQRYLRREDTSFQRVLGEARERLARHYLQHSALTGAEISLLLGYDDPNSFFRAFRTWTGQTPESLRAALSAANPPTL